MPNIYVDVSPGGNGSSSSSGGGSGESQHDYTFKDFETTDDSWSTVANLSPTNDALTVYLFHVRGFSIGGVGNTFTVRRAVKKVGGTVTGFPMQTLVADGDGVGDVRIHISGNNVLLQVKGDAVVPYDWAGELDEDVTISSGIQSLPEITAVDFDQVDPAGGDFITIAGNYFGGLVSVTLGGVESDIYSSTANEIIITTPSVASGTRDLVVNTGVGASDPFSMTVWTPSDDVNVTLLYDAKSTPYNDTFGTWESTFTVQPSDDTLEMTSFSSGNQLSASGAPSFDGNGAVEGGMRHPDNAYSLYYFGADSGGYRPGSIFAVFNFETTKTMETSDYYLDPAVLSTGLGSVAISAGHRSGDAEPIIRGFVYDGAVGGYKKVEVPATHGDQHSFVLSWGLGTTLDASVDGATSGAGFNQVSLINGLEGAYLAHVFRLGLTYPQNNVSQQEYNGTIRAWGCLNAKASSDFIVKLHKWAQARHGAV